MPCRIKTRTPRQPGSNETFSLPHGEDHDTGGNDDYPDGQRGTGRARPGLGPGWALPSSVLNIFRRMGMQRQSEIGVAGLAVMGENLVLNMADKGFSVAVYNRTPAKVDAFLAGRAKGKTINGFHTRPISSPPWQRPRRVMMMLKAGEAVDQFIDQLLPHLEAGDIVIDGGNSNYQRHHSPVAGRLPAKGLLLSAPGSPAARKGR